MEKQNKLDEILEKINPALTIAGTILSIIALIIAIAC